MKRIEKKNNTILKKYDYYMLGYQKFGPLLYGFVNWLKKEIKQEQITKIFFLSRDGFIMKKAFDLIKEENIESEYFYASRRSIIVPSLWKVKDINEIFDVITFGNDFTLKSFIKKIGLEDYDLKKYLFKYNLNVKDHYLLSEFKNDPKIIDFLNDILGIIIKNSREEYKNFKLYCNEKKLNGKVAIVDIGWFGTMQNALNHIVDDCEIHGYYIGVCPNSKVVNDKFHGYVFDKTHNQNKYNKYLNFISVLEFMTLAHHGSVKKFGNNAVNFYNYEYNNSLEELISSKIQNGALDFCNIKYQESLNRNQSKNYNFEDGIKIFEKMCCYPTLKEAKMLGNIKFKDEEFYPLAKPKSLFYYILNPQILKSDLKKTLWKIGFFKRLFKIKLPYLKIILLLKSRRKK